MGDASEPDQRSAIHRQSSPNTREVAIIGTACQLSGVNSPQELVDFCANRKCAARSIPPSRWKTEHYLHPDTAKPGHYNIGAGSYLERDVAAFDGPFFNLGEAEAVAMDPQERIMLETAYLALEDAGIPLSEISGRDDVGVFAGGSKSEYDNRIQQDRLTMPRYASSGNAMCMFANRLSYFFAVHGPSVTTDTACSSSLTALDAAFESIRSGRCNVAIVGGSFLQLSPLGAVGMGAIGTLAPGGRSLSFDASAEGYGRGDGSACIIIAARSLSERNYKPRALIRGTGINHCGRSQGITMPSRAAQVALIKDTYRRAGLEPRDTPFVEAHGTGTERGDGIEVHSIAEAFNVTDRMSEEPLWIGSVKPNVGHCEGASGVVSVVKCVAMLEHGVILPNVGIERPNEALTSYGMKLRVPTELMDWPSEQLKRISINNFGFGGSNAHIILEGCSNSSEQGSQKPLLQPSCGASQSGSAKTASKDQSTDRDLTVLSDSLSHRETSSQGRSLNLNRARERDRLFVVSARDEATLKLQISTLAGYLSKEALQRDQELDSDFLDDLSYTLNCRRSLFEWQAAFTANTM